MFRLDQVSVRLLFCVAIVGSLVGCGGVTTVQQAGTDATQTPPVTAGYAGPALSGRVLAGSGAVERASVQIFAAGTAGNGSAPTQLLAAAQSTDTAGHFDVAAGSYNCPSANSIIYAVARGGDISGAATAGDALVLINVIGPCASAGPVSIRLNEQSTVATAFALRSFLGTGGAVGASSTNAAGLQLAVSNLQRLVDPVTGSVPSSNFAANATAPAAKLNTLANLLHGCAVSASACTALFSAITLQGTAPKNTLDAAWAVANHPGLVLPAATASVFQPSLPSAPSDWTLGVAITGGGLHGPTSLAVDAAGSVWVANYYGVVSAFTNAGSPVYAGGIVNSSLQANYAGALDPNGRFWVTNEQNDDYTLNGGNGSLTVLTGGGAAAPASSTVSTGGLNAPLSIAFDRAGRAWVVDYGSSSLTVLDSGGIPQSGANGYTSTQLGFPVAVAVDSKGQAWVANQSASTVTRVSPDGATYTSYTVGSSPAAVAVDAADNVWTANFYADSVGMVGTDGTVHSGAGFLGGGLARPTGIALDGAGRVWVANYRARGVTELAGAADSTPGLAISGALGWGADLAAVEAFSVAIDAAGDVWLSSYGDSRVLELIGAATPVKTPLLGGVRLP